MHEFVKCAALGLSIIASSLAAGSTAAAETYTLMNKVTRNHPDPAKRMCLALAASNVTPGTPIIVWQCDGTPSQRWTEVPWRGLFALTTEAKPFERCIGVQAGSGADGAAMIIWNCNGTASMDQEWYKEDAGGGCYYLRNAGTGKYMGVKGGNVVQGERVIQWAKIPGHDDQVWCKG